MNEKYPILLSPGKIGNLEIRNKVVMASMGMSQSDNGFVNDAVVNHYAERAKGGVGLVLVEVTCVDTPLGLNTARMLVIDDDKYIPGMTRLASAIHEGGAKCLLQISHTGRGARRAITGGQPVAPSAVAMPYSYMMGLSNETPRALTIEEIHVIEEKYAQAALRAKKAGFDGVELHSVGYYLGQQFLSSTANVRTDEYGGNPENRIRFHLNIIKRIRELCGDDFVVAVKYSAVEQGEQGGITMQDGMYYAKRFQDAGVDALEVLAGTWATEASAADIMTTATPDCQAVGLCQAVKYGIYQMTGKPATIATIGGGHAQNPVAAEAALKEGKCDFIFIGHALLVQPDLVNLIDQDREDEIRPCIGCGVCIDIQLQDGATCACSGNAVLGQGDNDYSIPEATEKKNVVIVGAGIAGCEAARVAKLRGHNVVLVDKDDKIGGQIYYAAKPPQKDHIAKLPPFLTKQMERLSVDVRLNTEVNADDVVAMNPDVVICATGVKPAVLPVKGAEGTVSAKQVLDGAVTGDNVVVIGGGSVGLETAEFLVDQGKKVTVVEMLDKVAENMVNVTRTVLLGHLKAKGVTILTSVTVKEIGEGKVYCAGKEGEFELVADSVVTAIGDKANPALFEALQGKVKELYNVGDSAGAGVFYTALKQAYDVAMKI